ncbi:MAG: iron ABC transporter permease [Candidatus Bathyarchaeota archaeon]|nr:iron ABC transporter permease [Candidatus Bathyarchaeota archaeon]
MVDENQTTPNSQQGSFDVETEKKKYRRLMAKRGLFLVVSGILLIVVAGVALALGSANMTVLDAYAAVLARAFPDFFHVSALADNVVWNLRLPRILLAIFAGAALGMSGTTTQTILRNPIATPYTLGVSAGAGLGAAVGIILGKGFLEGEFLVIGNAFVFSLIPVAVILLLVKRRGASPETMILAGIAMVYIFSACTTILQYFAESNAVSATVFWLVGDLSRAAWWQLPYILGVLLICFLVNLKLSWDLNVMQMGDDSAKSLGVEVDRVRKVTLITACLSTATVVSFTGAIGFICLVAPHICRAIIGSGERFLIASSSLFGAVLLLFADIVARRLIAPIVLPVGAITAFLGGPLLLYLLIRKRISH